jgi:hypothetical protein
VHPEHPVAWYVLLPRAQHPEVWLRLLRHRRKEQGSALHAVNGQRTLVYVVQVSSFTQFLYSNKHSVTLLKLNDRIVGSQLQPLQT